MIIIKEAQFNDFYDGFFSGSSKRAEKDFKS